MPVARIPAQRKQAGTRCIHARTALASRKKDEPILSTGSELDPRWREWGIRDSFLPRFVALTLDPIAMTLQKMLDSAGRGSRRNDDLHAPCVKHTHG